MTLLPETSVAPDPAQAAELPMWKRWFSRAREVAGNRMSYALLDQVAYSFGNMVVAAVISRKCSQREFGMYILTQRSLDLVFQVCNVLIWAPCVFNLPGISGERQRTYRGSLYLQQLIACVLTVLAMVAASVWSSTPSRGLYYGTFHPLIWTSLGILFREYTRRMYFADMRFKEAFWTDAATVALQIAGVLLLWWRHALNVTNTLWELFAGAAIVSVWWLLRDGRRVRMSVRASYEDLKLNLHLGRWFLGSNLVFQASSQCSAWSLSAMLGGSAVGMYGLCEFMVNIPRVAMNSIQNMLGPMMARAYQNGGRAEVKSKVRRLNWSLLALSGTFCAILFFAGPLAGHLIFKQVPQRTTLALLALNLVAYSALLPEGYALTAIDRAGPTFYANAIGFAVQLASIVALVHWIHVPGAALALLLGSIVAGVVREMFFAREMRATA